MKCDVIDSRCQPSHEPVLRFPRRPAEQAARLTARLFRYRLLRARMFDRAMRELARRDVS